MCSELLGAVKAVLEVGWGQQAAPWPGGRTRTETGGPVLLGGILLSQKYKNITKLIKD